jgi:biliverdin reductase
MPEMTGYAKIALPIRVGLVGTGFAAKIRAQTLVAEPRTQLIAVAGRDPARTGAFADAFAVQAIADWQTLVIREDIDLIIVSTVNADHSAIVRAAIMAGKHTIVEYPLTLDPHDGAEIIALATQKGVMLHVEHIELLGGLHQTMREWLSAIGEVYHARYTTIVTQRPAPRKWTFHRSEFGFPLTGALSRLHRFSDLFGSVKSINCQNQYWGGEGEYYGTCLCTAQLRFEHSDAIGEVVYGKGEGLWENTRKFEVHGANGALIFNGDEGVLIQADKSTPLDLGSRKGLFARDTEFAIEHLLDGKPNYVTPIASLATLCVADAARVSAETGEVIKLGDN